MEKYLRYEPRLNKPSSCKRSRLSNSTGRIMAGCKSPSVDDILAFKNDDQIMIRLQKPDDEDEMDDLDSDAEDRLSLDELNLWDEVHSRKPKRNPTDFLSVGSGGPYGHGHASEDRVSLSSVGSSSSSMQSLTSVLDPVKQHIKHQVDPNGNLADQPVQNNLVLNNNRLQPQPHQSLGGGSKNNQLKSFHPNHPNTLTPPSSPESIPSSLITTRNGNLVKINHVRGNSCMPRLISLTPAASAGGPIAALKSAQPLPPQTVTASSTGPSTPVRHAKSMLRLDVSSSVPATSQAVAADDDSKRRIHKCTFPNCQKVYTKSSHLKAHQRTHTGNFLRLFSILQTLYSMEIQNSRLVTRMPHEQGSST